LELNESDEKVSIDGVFTEPGLRQPEDAYVTQRCDRILSFYYTECDVSCAG